MALVTEGEEYLSPLKFKDCPDQACPRCKRARPAFPTHVACIEFFKLLTTRFLRPEDHDPNPATTITKAQLRCLYKLGEALLPSALESGLDTWKSSFRAAVFDRLFSLCSNSHAKERSSVQSILEGLSRLPRELQDAIAACLFPDTNLFSRLPIIFGATSVLLEEIERNPAGQSSLTIHAEVFVERFEFGAKSYISKLSNEKGPQSTTSCVLSSITVVRLNDVGIIDVGSLSSLDQACQTSYPSTEWLYTISTTDKIFMQTRVCQLVTLMSMD